MDDIGEMVGMNKVSIYYYFKNKEALFKEMLFREYKEYSDRMKPEIERIEDSKGRILAWIEASLRYGQKSGIFRQFSIETLKRLSPLLDEFRIFTLSAGMDFVASNLKDGCEQGDFKKCDAARVSGSIVKLMYALKDSAYKKHAANPEIGMDIDGLIREVLFLVGMILDGLRPLTET